MVEVEEEVVELEEVVSAVEMEVRMEVSAVEMEVRMEVSH